MYTSALTAIYKTQVLNSFEANFITYANIHHICPISETVFPLYKLTSYGSFLSMLHILTIEGLLMLLQIPNNGRKCHQ